jgi:NitT/TauT family transport system permease protein
MQNPRISRDMSDEAIAAWGETAPRFLLGKTARFAVFAASMVLLLGAAEVLLRAFPLALLPPPDRIAFVLARGGRGFWLPLVTTIRDLLVGLAMGAGAGFALGLLFAPFATLRSIVRPYFVLLVATPALALVPLLAHTPGLGPRFAVALASAPIVLMATVAGFTRVDPLQVTLARSLGATRRRSFTSVSLPQAIPAAIMGFGASALLALVTAVGAEMLDGRRGVGRLLLTATSTGQAPMLFAAVLILAAIGLLVAGVPLWIGLKWMRRLV